MQVISAGAVAMIVVNNEDTLVRALSLIERSFLNGRTFVNRKTFVSRETFFAKGDAPLRCGAKTEHLETFKGFFWKVEAII